MKLSALAFCALPALLAASAQAVTSAPYTSSIPSTLTDFSGTLTFPQFNPALGTLTGVDIKITSAVSTTLTVTNNSPSGSTGNAKTEVGLIVQDVGNNLNGDTLPLGVDFPTSPLLDLLTPAFNYNLGAGQSLTSGTLTKNGSSDDFYTSPIILSIFTGGGNISLSAATRTQTVLANSGGNTDATQTTYGSVTGVVTYYYEVPEPASLALVGLGALALLARRRH